MAHLLADAQQADRAAFGGFVVCASVSTVTIRALEVARASRSPASSNNSAFEEGDRLALADDPPLADDAARLHRRG